MRGVSRIWRLAMQGVIKSISLEFSKYSKFGDSIGLCSLAASKKRSTTAEYGTGCFSDLKLKWSDADNLWQEDIGSSRQGSKAMRSTVCAVSLWGSQTPLSQRIFTRMPVSALRSTKQSALSARLGTSGGLRDSRWTRNQSERSISSSVRPPQLTGFKHYSTGTAPR